MSPRRSVALIIGLCARTALASGPASARRKRAQDHLASAPAGKEHWTAMTWTDAAHLPLFRTWLAAYRGVTAGSRRWALLVVAADPAAAAGVRLRPGAAETVVEVGNYFQSKGSALVEDLHAHISLGPVGTTADGAPDLARLAHLAQRRPLQILEALRSAPDTTAGIFFTDVDAVWLADPLAVVDRKAHDGCDVVVGSRGNKWLPSAILLRKGGRSKKLMAAWAQAEGELGDDVFPSDVVRFRLFSKAEKFEPTVALCAFPGFVDAAARGVTAADLQPGLISRPIIAHVSAEANHVKKEMALRRLGLWAKPEAAAA